MLTLFGYEITKKILGYIIAAVAIIMFLVIYPRMDNIKEFFGIDTVHSLRKKNENLSTQISQLDQTNKNNLKELEIVSKNYKDTLLTLQNLNEENERIKEESTTIEKERKRALEDLKRIQAAKGAPPYIKDVIEPYTATKIDLDKVSPSTATSIIQMSSIWAKYCLLTDYEDKECNPYKPKTIEEEK